MKKLYFFTLLISGCNRNNTPVYQIPKIEFGQPIKVDVQGYSGNLMEPFISRDGNTLLFNNLNAAPENTNLHWATKINDTTFQYKSEIKGVNTLDLEGVPTLDNSGNLYFVSLRSYVNTLSTLYQCNFQNGTATNIQLVGGVSKLQGRWLNFDVEVSADGQNIYFVDAQFDQTNNPASADIIIAEKNASGFQRISNSAEIMKNINTIALEYAACISVDQLELYFTRVSAPITATSSPEILVSRRNNKTEPFSSPSKIASIEGFVEAPTIAPDQRTIYFHKKENNKLVLYLVRKK